MKSMRSAKPVGPKLLEAEKKAAASNAAAAELAANNAAAAKLAEAERLKAEKRQGEAVPQTQSPPAQPKGTPPENETKGGKRDETARSPTSPPPTAPGFFCGGRCCLGKGNFWNRYTQPQVERLKQWFRTEEEEEAACPYGILKKPLVNVELESGRKEILAAGKLPDGVDKGKCIKEVRMALSRVTGLTAAEEIKRTDLVDMCAMMEGKNKEAMQDVVPDAALEQPVGSGEDSANSLLKAAGAAAVESAGLATPPQHAIAPRALPGSPQAAAQLGEGRAPPPRRQ